MRKVTPRSEVVERGEYPWGNDNYGSDAHKEWLVDKIIKSLNQALKKTKPAADGTYHVRIKSDLSQWPGAAMLLAEKIEEAGWTLHRVIWRDAGHQARIELR